MKWILIVMSAGAYNFGTVSGIEFNTEDACNHAELVMEKKLSSTETICVPKGIPSKE